ncbi:MAG: hypothetical protein ACI9TY_000881 [Alphaproteobacteria bacterium]|jgi:hypothetical protein
MLLLSITRKHLKIGPCAFLQRIHEFSFIYYVKWQKAKDFNVFQKQHRDSTTMLKAYINCYLVKK